MSRSSDGGRRRRCGYILLETMAAVAVLSIALTSILAAFRVSLSAAARARHTTAATLLAEGKMAELRASPPAALGTAQGDFGEDMPEYTWRTTLSPVDSYNCCTAVVEVTWMQEGRPRSVVLGSLLPIRPIGGSG